MIVVLLLTMISCNENPFKCSGKDNTSRPAIPDNKGRNVGDDGTVVYLDAVQIKKVVIV